ncbi:tetratricopeptide repeat protein 27-like [Pollicipes pollicipes]|uniref:tetratricopeptide repeat protein 27-like n=1 Tax=Pollicipes pollicipes TaxID=41117 RepID=UPI0018859D4A|nr:tetratricopeptide repeat protein 27-like [Pollicipes pollicipes]
MAVMHLEKEKELVSLRHCKQSDNRLELDDTPLHHILQGHFKDVLNLEDIRRVLSLDATELWKSWDLEAIAAHVSASLNSASSDSGELLLLGAVAALCLFAQANWTGPELDWADVLPVTGSEQERARCLACLAVDGSECYQLMRCPEALGIARVVFEGCQNHLSSFPSFPLWRIRYGFLHQQVLDEASPHLFDLFLKDIRLSENTLRLLESSTQVAVEHHLTVAGVYSYHHHVTEAAQHLATAQRRLGISLELVGALGRRTYFQEARPQLALRVAEDGLSPAGDSPLPAPEDPPGCAELPRDLRLGDDTRRERVQYEDAALEAAASPLRQAVILSKFFQEQRAQGRDAIRDEQLLVLLAAVTRQPHLWAVQLSALLQRSRLESGERRTVERAMTQTQTLVDAVTEAAPSAVHRLQLFFCSLVPTRWEMEGELAARYLALGVTKAALEVYERLQLWEEAIKCYHLLQQRQRAEEVIRQRIELSGETPKLLCLLGDATDDVTCYQRAWEMSGHQSVRALRSEGLHYYHRKQYSRCIPFLLRAVEMNSLQFDVWSRLAYAALETEDWKTCARAYRQCCYLEPDNFEAWNNIAHAYIKLGQKDRAWKTLQEALKFSFDNWKIWENFLVVSVDIGEFEEAVNAYGRLADVRERHVDAEVLRLLVGAVIGDTVDRHGLGAGRLRRRVAALFGRLTAAITTDADLWSLYGDLSAGERSDEARHRTMQYYQKAHRCLAQRPAAEKQPELARQMLQIVVKLADAALDWAEVTQPGGHVLQTLSSVKLAARGTLTKVKAAQSDLTGQVTEQLRPLHGEAEAALQRVLDAIQSRQGS